MKAEERKELQTNSLQRFLGRLGKNIKAGPSRRGAVIWGILLLAVVVFIGWRIASRVSASRNSHRWLELDMVGSTDDLADYIQKNKGTIQANVAELQIARQKLKEGLAGLYTTRESAREQLGESAEKYEELAKQFKSTPILVQECLLGAGKAREGRGEFNQALEHYQKLEVRCKDGPLVKEAVTRADAIKNNKSELVRLNEEIEKLPDPTAKRD